MEQTTFPSVLLPLQQMEMWRVERTRDPSFWMTMEISDNILVGDYQSQAEKQEFLYVKHCQKSLNIGSHT